MKIVHVVSSYGLGGLERHVVDLVNELSKRGGDVFLVADQQYSAVLDDRINHIPMNFSASRYSLPNLIKLLVILTKINPDIIHSHAGKASYLLRALKPFVSSKLICTVHGLKKSKQPYSSFDSIIVPSSGVKKHYNFESCHVIYHGLDIGIYTPKTRATPSTAESVKWVTIGRLEHVKGYDMLLEAFQKVPGHLTLIGDGTERRKLKDLAIKLGILDRVTFEGKIPNAAKKLKHYDIAVISSRREAFSYFFAESYTANLPIVSTDVPVGNEILNPSYLAECNQDSIAEAMKKTLIDYLSGNYPEYEAKNLFSINNMVDKILKIYHEPLLKK